MELQVPYAVFNYVVVWIRDSVIEGGREGGVSEGRRGEQVGS